MTCYAVPWYFLAEHASTKPRKPTRFKPQHDFHDGFVGAYWDTHGDSFIPLSALEGVFELLPANYEQQPPLVFVRPFRF